MNGFPWIIIGIAIGLILTGILVVVTLKIKKEGYSKGTDYRAFFTLGISFLALGIIYEIVLLVSCTKVFLVLGIVFIGLGISYLAIGLGNKDKWQNK